MKLTTHTKILSALIISFIALLAGVTYTNFLPGCSPIADIDSFAQAQSVLDKADANTLVLFDVDDTLLVPTNKIFRNKNLEKNAAWYTQLRNETLGKATKNEWELLHLWVLKDDFMLMEPDIVDTIRSLQDRGVKVLALTALVPGRAFAIPSMAHWRFENLKKHGIDFSKTSFGNMTFDELPTIKDAHDNPQHPVLYKGIICTTKLSKGDVLGAFLNRVNFKPTQIIFFDDKLERVKEVEKEVQKRGIAFYGFVYHGAEHLPEELDKKLGEYQLHHLVKHEEWINEDEARELLGTQAK